MQQVFVFSEHNFWVCLGWQFTYILERMYYFIVIAFSSNNYCSELPRISHPMNLFFFDVSVHIIVNNGQVWMGIVQYFHQLGQDISLTVWWTSLGWLLDKPDGQWDGKPTNQTI